ncbi:hypothetical protein [Krasilnikoviella flava]|uniref:DUF1648 domain-containing protein n=1 Tax=Krasilnikoviella flava TaxID=526729 RepID=A0A1T5LQG2_9MICO|nr:hypothetical protein [Krasilnikoviella flava]SKC78172.1 hypothetical protein SAMN04324258_3743 [Krasilnikoviella flava]
MTPAPPPGSSRTAGTEAWRPRARRAMTWSSLAGLLFALAGAAVVWTWRDELPAQVASHWSGSTPDGFMAPTTLAVVGVVAAVGLCALFAAIGITQGAAAATRRITAAGCVWSGAFMATITVTTLAPQRGLVDAAQAELSGAALLATFLLPLVPAAIAAALVPGDPAMPATEAVPDDAPRAALRDGERAVWLRRATGGPGIAVGAAAVALTTLAAALTAEWTMLVVPAALAALFVTMFAFTVRVDAAGLTVRSAARWPGTHVPADEVVRASVTQVRPMRDYGGWGWRTARDGRVGVVLRSGEALLVERTGGRSFAVTVDGAADAAALLNAMADRSRRH